MKGIRVANTSAFPGQIAVHTTAAVIALGERASDLILHSKPYLNFGLASVWTPLELFRKRMEQRTASIILLYRVLCAPRYRLSTRPNRDVRTGLRPKELGNKMRTVKCKKRVVYGTYAGL